MTATPICLRFAEPDDLEILVRSERNAHAVAFTFPEAPLLGKVQGTQPWAWDENDFMVAVRQYRDKVKGTYETRTLVAEIPFELTDQITGESFWADVGIGGICYEIQDDGYEILLLTIDPELIGDEPIGKLPGRGEVLDGMLKLLVEKTARSKKRAKVSFYVPDGNYKLLKELMDRGWKWKRIDSYFAFGDAWLCQLEASPQPEKSEPAAA